MSYLSASQSIAPNSGRNNATSCGVNFNSSPSCGRITAPTSCGCNVGRMKISDTPNLGVLERTEIRKVYSFEIEKDN